jgi:hypothetical protein
MRKKEQDRQSRFEPKNKKFKPNSSRGKEKECEVSINIGYMKVDNDGNLKRCRGKTPPIEVLPSAGRSEILEKAVRKHANHDKNILGELEHVLLNADGNQIEKIPGTEKEFLLRDYREELGKSYNRLTLFIALSSAYAYAEVSKLKACCEDSESGSDNGSSDLNETRIAVPARVNYDSNSGDIKNATDTFEKVFSPAPANSTSASVPSTSSQLQDVVKDICKEQLIECPTCLQYFSINRIAEHADMCCDIWVGAVNHEKHQ